jgi:hypothetical protein
MTLAHRSVLAAAATALAVVAAGCGFGPGESSDGEATLRVTRDYGNELMVDASVSDPTESDTVIRVLDREAEITTRYGGGFVQSIEGLAGGIDGGRSFDWFFYVNGIESPVGAADVPLHGGDRVWWDYRDWTDAMRVPAVVGSWPEPMAQESAGADRLPVRVECAAREAACDDVVERLAEEGVTAGAEPFAEALRDHTRQSVRVLVGPWSKLRRDPAAAQLSDGPERSGVFARFERSPSGWGIAVLGADARTAARIRAHGGLVAAVREGDDPATLLVAGADQRGVESAIGLLDSDDLRDRYAMATGPGGRVPAPVPEGAAP